MSRENKDVFIKKKKTTTVFLRHCASTLTYLQVVVWSLSRVPLFATP